MGFELKGESYGVGDFVFVLASNNGDPLCCSVYRILALWEGDNNTHNSNHNTRNNKSKRQSNGGGGGSDLSTLCVTAENKRMCFKGQKLWHMRDDRFVSKTAFQARYLSNDQPTIEYPDYHPNMLLLSNQIVIGCLSTIAGMPYCNTLSLTCTLAHSHTRSLSYHFHTHTLAQFNRQM